jgi:hypothetical protein
MNAFPDSTPNQRYARITGTGSMLPVPVMRA